MRLSVLSTLALAATAFAQQAPLLPPKHGSHTELIKLHRELVEISSVSGTEEEAGKFLRSYLQNLGYTVETQVLDKSKGRFNLYAYLGETRSTRILLTSHYDTVPSYIPYSHDSENAYGRGTVDAKSCVAAQITALEELRGEHKIKEGDVGLLFVVDEEVYGQGMKLASNVTDVEWDTVIFGEPTELKLGVGHKGIAIATYKAHGKAAHSGYPELGINANTILIEAMAELLQTEFPADDLLGPTTINVGKFQGGVAANVVPGDAESMVAIRIAAARDQVVDKLHQIAEDREHLELSFLYTVDPQHLTFDVEGFDSIVLAYSTDVPNLEGNFTKYLYGPGSIHVAHGADEFVSFDDLVESVDGYKRLVSLDL